MTQATGSNGNGRNIMIIAVVSLLVVAGIGLWATTRNQTTERAVSATTSGSANTGDKKAEVNLKVELPDSVTINAH